ncbi:hypothetical protein BH11PAT1_BH11PAT1_5210 [soil metagenome]
MSAEHGVRKFIVLRSLKEKFSTVKRLKRYLSSTHFFEQTLQSFFLNIVV